MFFSDNKRNPVTEGAAGIFEQFRKFLLHLRRSTQDAKDIVSNTPGEDLSASTYPAYVGEAVHVDHEAKTVDIHQIIASGRVFQGTVTKIETDNLGCATTYWVTTGREARGENRLVGMIPADEFCEAKCCYPTSWLMGHKVDFVAVGYDKEKRIFRFSQKPIYEEKRKKVEEALSDGKAMRGYITGFTAYGAYVNVAGIDGILRNSDFSSDTTRVDEVYAIGDAVDVLLDSKPKQLNAGRINWRAYRKYRRTEPIKVNVGVGDIVGGHVVDIKDLEKATAVFVRLDENKHLDALCSVPDFDVAVGVDVILRVTKVVFPDDPLRRPRLKGTILQKVV